MRPPALFVPAPPPPLSTGTRPVASWLPIASPCRFPLAFLHPCAVAPCLSRLPAQLLRVYSSPDPSLSIPSRLPPPLHALIRTGMCLLLATPLAPLLTRSQPWTSLRPTWYGLCSPPIPPPPTPSHSLHLSMSTSPLFVAVIVWAVYPAVMLMSPALCLLCTWYSHGLCLLSACFLLAV